MRIVSFNLNGIRAAMGKGLRDWVFAHDADMYLFQEIKIDEATLNALQLDWGDYHWHAFSAEKKGYSGVATLSKQKPDQVIQGVGHELFDAEGRFVITDINDCRVVNVYMPSGTSGEHRQDVKEDFMRWFADWMQQQMKLYPKLIIAGDYNIANTELDIHDPVRNKNTSGFLPHERAWLSELFSKGMHDSYRTLFPDQVDYSWWSYRANARANNKGWRIDYISVSDALKPALQDARILSDVVMSDHCPIEVQLAI